MAGFANRSYYDAAEKGRVDRDLAVSRQAHNALSNQQVQQNERVNALMADPQATPEAYARVGRSDVANALTNIDANRQGVEQEGHKRLFIAAQYALQSPDPKAFIAQNFPELAKANPTFDTDTPEQIAVSLQHLLGTYGANAGIGPPQPKTPEPFTLNPGDVRFGPDGKQIASVAPKPEKTPGQFRPATPEEIRAVGLPEGTAAQVNVDTKQVIPFPRSALPSQRPLPPAITKGLIENNSNIRKIDAAIAALERYPDAFGARNYLGDAIRQRTDPKGVDPRAKVADIGSLIIHDRSGAAVSAAEFPRLAPFIPQATDDPATVKTKLENLKANIQMIQEETQQIYSTDQGYKEFNAGPAAPTVGPTATDANGNKVVYRNGQWQPL